MKTFEVEVTQIIRVTLDETKFTEEWMEEFRKYFFPFYNVKDHAEHIAQMEARGVLDYDFVEGYGDPAEMGIECELVSQYEEAQEIES